MIVIDRSSEALGAPPQPLGFCGECDRCLCPPIARILPSCGHRFCHSCLLKQFPCGSLTVVCPTCHTFCIVPLEGIEAFSPRPASRAQFRSLIIESVRRRMAAAAYAVLNEEADDSGVETNANLSLNIDNTSGPDPASPKIMSTSSGPTTSADNGWWECFSHPGHGLRLYCRQCRAPLCDQCTEYSYEHSSHTVVVLKDAVDQQTRLLRTFLAQLKHKLAACRLKLIKTGPTTTSDEECSANEMNPDPVRESLNDCFDRLLESLRKGKSELSYQLGGERKKRQKLFEEERLFWLRRINEITEECKKADTMVEKQSQDGNLEDFTFEDFSKRLLTLVDGSLSESLEQPEPNDVVLFYPAYLPALQEFVEKLGVIGSRSQLKAEGSVRGDGLRYCCLMVNTEITLTVRAKFGGKLVHVDPDHIRGNIVMKSTCLIQELVVHERTNGIYQLNYTLPEEGTYRLSIFVFDRHIRGSPFTVQCVSEKRYGQEHCSIHSKTRSSRSRTSSSRTAPIEDDLILKVGSKGIGLWGSRLKFLPLKPPFAGYSSGRFCNPQGICCMADGKIAVADSGSHCVQLFSDQGICTNKFGIRGRLPGMMTRPTGVVSLSSGSIGVSDYETRYINVFDPDDGHLIGRFGGNKLLGPKGMTLDNQHNRLVVVDNKASSVVIYDEATHKLIHSFGSRGSKPHQLAGPHFVAYNSSNHLLYVTDFHHHCVKVFDFNGEHIFSFGCNGMGNGQFNAPTGIAIDDNHNLLVADWGNNRIQVFDSNGSFISFVNMDADPVFGPQGLTITADGYVAVADSGNHCYKIYRYLT